MAITMTNPTKPARGFNSTIFAPPRELPVLSIDYSIPVQTNKFIQEGDNF
jgi:hypothetical protein